MLVQIEETQYEMIAVTVAVIGGVDDPRVVRQAGIIQCREHLGNFPVKVSDRREITRGEYPRGRTNS